MFPYPLFFIDLIFNRVFDLDKTKLYQQQENNYTQFYFLYQVNFDIIMKSWLQNKKKKSKIKCNFIV